MTNTERAEALLRIVTDLSAMRTNGADIADVYNRIGIVKIKAVRMHRKWSIDALARLDDGHDDVDVYFEGSGESYDDALSDALDDFATVTRVQVQHRLDWAEEAGE